jgi:hypothetical protein
MSATSHHKISQANCLNFDAYTATKHDLWQKDHILMLDVDYLSKSPKVALNFSRNASKLLSKGDWCSKKNASQVRVVLDNKVPMSLTWVGPVKYWWRLSWMTRHAWLTKPWNFECVPSNLLGRLIRGSFGWSFVVETIPKRLELGKLANEK